MLYAITDRRQHTAEEAARREHLLDLAARWKAGGVAFVQLREKDLSGREQVELARALLAVLRGGAGPQRVPRLLINGRPDVALAADADGVHLPSGEETLTPEEVRRIFAGSAGGDGTTKRPFLSVACHTLLEVERARGQQADCILFSPVFGKIISESGAGAAASERRLPGTGSHLLAEACRVAAPVPVLALGGVTAENARQCLAAGAAGIAAIRLLQTPADRWRDLA